MRDEFYLDGLNCEPYSFDAACQQLNREYQKNKNKDEIKSHHYIISFDPRDSTENCLTGKTGAGAWTGICKSKFSGASGFGLYAHGRSQWQRQHSCPYRNQQFAKIGCAPAALHGATHRLQGRVQAPCDERVSESTCRNPLWICATANFCIRSICCHHPERV